MGSAVYFFFLLFLVEEFLKSRGLKSLGIPRFHGFGHHKFKNVDYRFIVIDKLGKDLNSILKKDNTLPYATILKIGIQIVSTMYNEPDN